MKDFPWTPKYIIRESIRAKRVSLRISLRKGLEVIIPIGFKHKKIAKLLAEKRSWIEKHLPKIKNLPKPTLPNTLALKAIDETWDINYTAAITNRVTLIPKPQNQLAIMGNINDHDLCHGVTNKWLQNKGKLHLVPWLDELSHKTGLKYNNVTIRSQKTRWGSCSAQNDINLNGKLLLLEPEFVDYIMIHELCHTKHHNHSAKFWHLVEQFIPNYLELRKKLRHTKL